MTDGKDPQPEVTYEDVVKFFEEQGASIVCPICQFDKWGVTAIKLGEENMLAPKGVNRETIEVRAAIAACKKCGFIRFHDLRVVEWWMGQKKNLIGGSTDE